LGQFSTNIAKSPRKRPHPGHPRFSVLTAAELFSFAARRSRLTKREFFFCRPSSIWKIEPSNGFFSVPHFWPPPARFFSPSLTWENGPPQSYHLFFFSPQCKIRITRGRNTARVPWVTPPVGKTALHRESGNFGRKKNLPNPAFFFLQIGNGAPSIPTGAKTPVYYFVYPAEFFGFLGEIKKKKRKPGFRIYARQPSIFIKKKRPNRPGKTIPMPEPAANTGPHELCP